MKRRREGRREGRTGLECFELALEGRQLLQLSLVLEGGFHSLCVRSLGRDGRREGRGNE